MIKTISYLENKLFENYNENGYWTGDLSSSAVSTALAITSLYIYDKYNYKSEIIKGINWLQTTILDCGGWGDTKESPPNVTASILAFASLSYCKYDYNISATIEKSKKYLSQFFNLQDSNSIANYILNSYGNDKTFSVPILSLCAITGLLGKDETAWNYFPQLPFELSIFPHNFYKFFKLPVVSYALPALISIGIVQYKLKKQNFFLKLLKNFAVSKSLRKLNKIQPENGGFLEAVPLTAFCCICLIKAGFKNLKITTKGISFIKESILSEGSWRIDTNLNHWITTLAVKTLDNFSDNDNSIPIKNYNKLNNTNSEKMYNDLLKNDKDFSNTEYADSGNIFNNNLKDDKNFSHTEYADSGNISNKYLKDDKDFSNTEYADSGNIFNNNLKDDKNFSHTYSYEFKKIANVILERQYKKLHFFTNSLPGGWGWTNLPGAVPDADDTSSSLIALFKLLNGKCNEQIINGLKWLINIQNDDGGMPTFCKGWGKLPFDRSCPDISAHALSSFNLWYPKINDNFKIQIKNSMVKLKKYIELSQNNLGYWIPLWFGDQDSNNGEAPVLGTAMVLSYLNDGSINLSKNIIDKSLTFLVKCQNNDGSWAGNKDLPGKIIITARVISALSKYRIAENECKKGIDFLIHKINSKDFETPEPIGLYFSKLWYSEKMYNIIFCLKAFKDFYNSKRCMFTEQVKNDILNKGIAD